MNISILEVPINENKKLKDAMYLTADPLYKNIEVKFEDLHKIAKSDYRQYSPFIYQDGIKKSEFWNNDKQDLIIFDIDDGLSINQAKRMFSEYKYLICTTKSHRVIKKDKICDRYRIIFHAVNVPKGDKYFEMMRFIETKYPFIDKQVNTKTGSFLGFSGCEYWYNAGQNMDCNIFLRDMDRLKSIVKVEPKPQREPLDGDIDIQNIKERITRDVAADIIRSCGFEVNRHYKFKFRASERTPSASIKHDGLIKDFGGSFCGDIISFLQVVENLNFIDAVKKVSAYI